MKLKNNKNTSEFIFSKQERTILKKAEEILDDANTLFYTTVPLRERNQMPYDIPLLELRKLLNSRVFITQNEKGELK